jgi:serine/threonine protein kinase
MTEVSKKEFLARVNESRVVEAKRLKEWLRASNTNDAMDLAAKLVRDRLLTQWQAKYLMSGRTRLDIGSYRLLERIQRDALGDRFLAIHNQLGRKVEIQVLPLDLTRDQQRCDAFIQKASLAAKLDHPNLSHVYDIDQEGGRYFLVTEHLEGVTLDLAPRLTLNEFDVARVVKQAIAGLEFAHENQVVHGDLKQSDLQLVNDQEIKIKNIAVSPLRSSSSGSDDEKIRLQDYKAIAQIGYSVLKEIPPADGPSHLESLTTMFRSLASGNADSIKLAAIELANWWAKHAPQTAKGRPLSVTFDHEDQPFDLSGSGTADFEGGFDQPAASALTQPLQNTNLRTANRSDFDEDDFDDEMDDEFETPSWLTRTAQENPVGLIATVAVLLLMLFAGGGYVAYSMNWQPDLKSIADNTPTKTEFTNPTGTPTENPKTETTGKLSQPADDPPPVDFSNPEAMQRQIKAAIGSSAQQPKSDTSKRPNPKTETQPKPGTSKPKDNGQSAETAAASPPEPKTSESQNPKVVKTIRDKPRGPSNPAVDTNPFKNFPTTVSLPATEDQTERKIGELKINNRYLLGAEILAHETISRSKTTFVMDRDPADNQRWIVTGKRNERDSGEPIAAFRKTDSAFFFKWLPAALENKQAGYLQNCLIKLVIPDQTGWLKLRSPVVVEPMKLTESEFSAEMVADLEFLPDPEIIAVEIMDSGVPETALSPNLIEFEQNLPGRILLMPKDPEAFVWVQVDAAFKSRFRAQAEVKVHAAGRVQSVKNMNMLLDLESGLKIQHAVALNEYNSKKDLPAPKGMKTKYEEAKAELLKASEIAQAQAVQGSQYVQTLPKFFDQPIGIRIVAKIDGHEIELLQTQMPPVSSQSKGMAKN